MINKYSDLVKRVALKAGDERASKCGFDLLNSIDDRKMLDKKLSAWERYLLEFETGVGQIDTERDGVWVPAIEEK